MKRAAPLVLVFFLAGCGGSGGAESTSRPTTAPAQKRPTSEVPVQQPSTAKDGGRRTQSRPSGISPTDPSPLPNEGTKEPAPGVPITHGDNSIQTYGVEADGEERVDAATILKEYLAAQLNRRWSKACSLLLAETRENLQTFYEHASAKTQVSCEQAMAALISRIPEGPLRTLGEIHVLSMRSQGEHGFLIYDDGDGKPSESAMQREDGAWKVRGLIAKDLLMTASGHP